MDFRPKRLRLPTLFLAFISGTGFASLLVLALNTPWALVQIAAAALMVPGAIALSIVLGTHEMFPPLAILAANALIYSLLACVLSVRLERPRTDAARRWAFRLALPSTLAITLALIPAFNPMWPQGIENLTRREDDLRRALPFGTSVHQARNVLALQGIAFRDHIETSPTLILSRGGMSMRSTPGDRVLSARFGTDATSFLCSYDMEIVLLFGKDEKLKQSHIGHLRLCL